MFKKIKDVAFSSNSIMGEIQYGKENTFTKWALGGEKQTWLFGQMSQFLFSTWNYFNCLLCLKKLYVLIIFKNFKQNRKAESLKKKSPNLTLFHGSFLIMRNLFFQPYLYVQTK